MHYKIILLFLFFFGEILSQEIVKIDIKGFGEVNVIKNGEVFTVDLGELGKFDFKGSIDPISLEGSAGIDDLKSFPGYKLFTKIDLKEIGLKIEKSGLEISAAVETKGSLAKLFSFFKIDKPLLGVTVKVGKKEFALSGELDFSLVNIVNDDMAYEIMTTEPLVWVTSSNHLTHETEPLSLAIESNCLWGRWVQKALDRDQRQYRVGYSTFNIAGIVAIIEAGLAVSVMSRSSVPSQLRILQESDGFPELPHTRIGLVLSTGELSPAAQRMADSVRQSLTAKSIAA